VDRGFALMNGNLTTRHQIAAWVNTAAALS